ncbi:MAG: mucoidy inhibitor MuiA family protein [Sphingobacteriaceae bacterium]|nr:mucoidy inhibitor MuiA family protein [Sphingobacteriaceae bacterium]
MKHNLLLALLLLPGVAGALDTLQLRSSISEVTLFFTGAQITRTAELQLPAGETVVLLKGLSKHLQPASLQVSGLGEVTLLSLRSALIEVPVKSDKAALAQLEREEKALQHGIQDLKNEMAVYEQEEKILLQNSGLEQNRTNAVQTLREGADFYRQRLLDLRRMRTALSRRIDAKQEELRALYAQMNQLQPIVQPASQGLYLHLKASKPHKQTLVLKYFDEAASWKPTYEFRVSAIGKPMEVVYQAEVMQFGGEDWKNVPLVLSTANPFLSSTKPELQKWVLGVNHPGKLLQPSAPIQNQTYQQRTGKLAGKVLDEMKPKEGIPFAQVQLWRDDKLQSSTTSDIDGKYHFDKLQPGLYELRVSYIGFNPAKFRKVQVNADKSTFYDLKLMSGTSLMQVVVQDYEQPLISKDETRQGGSITREEIAALPTRDVNSIAATNGGVYFNQNGAPLQVRGSRGDAQEYFIDGIRVRGSTNLPIATGGLPARQMQFLIEELIAKPDALLEYRLGSAQTLLSDGEPQQIEIKKTEIYARFVYHLVPRVSKEAFLTAEIDNFGLLQLLDGPATVYYQGTYVGKTWLNTGSLSDTLLVGLGRDPGLQAVRVQQRDEKSRRAMSGQVRQEVVSLLVVRSSKEVAVQVVLDDQVPTSNQGDLQIDYSAVPAAELLPELGVQRWKFEIAPGGKQEFLQTVNIRYRASN